MYHLTVLWMAAVRKQEMMWMHMIATVDVAHERADQGTRRVPDFLPCFCNQLGH
jgi:hypothetical protein